LLTRLSERLQKQTLILVVNEYRLPTVSAIHHMVNHSSYSTRSLRGMAHNTSIVISDPYSDLSGTSEFSFKRNCKSFCFTATLNTQSDFFVVPSCEHVSDFPKFELFRGTTI